MPNFLSDGLERNLIGGYISYLLPIPGIAGARITAGGNSTYGTTSADHITELPKEFSVYLGLELGDVTQKPLLNIAEDTRGGLHQ